MLDVFRIASQHLPNNSPTPIDEASKFPKIIQSTVRSTLEALKDSGEQALCRNISQAARPWQINIPLSHPIKPLATYLALLRLP